MMPAAADNPDGFWEHVRFVDLNDEILSAVGGAWDLPPWEDETFQNDRLDPIRAKAQLLITPFQTARVWGWKDPRNSLTLPFWRSVLPGLKTIVMVRNPLEVAYSMHKRNGTSYALGLRLWEIYNRRVLANTQPEERIITNYQAFFDEPELELRKIAGFTGLADTEIAAAANLVAAGRRHTAFTVEQMIDAGVSQEIVTLYQSLSSDTIETPARDESSPSVTINVDRLSGAESRLDPRIPDGENIRRELATRRGDEIHHREEIGRYQGTIEDLRKELGATSVNAAAEINRRDGRIEELQKAYAHIDQLLLREHDQRNELLKERQELLGNLAQVRDRFHQTNQLLQTLSVRLAHTEARNTSLTDRLRKQLLELKKLLRLFDQVDAAADRLRRSRRWKLANPFSALRAALTGKPLEGFGHLDKNVEKFRAWRSSHPETESLAEEIQVLRSYEVSAPPISLECTSSMQAPLAPASKPPLPTKPIEFVRPGQVEVSIIIPVYNQVAFTLACLASIQQHSGITPYEVIVVDDSSTDATPEIVGAIPGITYLRAEANAGFIATCNRGAEAARGTYLLFLNNDTTVTAGWLTALHDTFKFEPKAGLVGSKLVYPDGRLQEAGGIIWRDGSGWNRGKFQDPGRPEYNYLREVDYCSAASVMIPKQLFDTLGGFDRKYAPAYYEDTDLAFKVAAQGLSVLYQPLSVVIHYEGITGGTDITSGTKKYQEINRSIFAASWTSVLAQRPENGDLATYETPKTGAKRILVIDHHLPMPDRDSGSLRMFQILTLLRQLGHRITFVPDNLADIPPYGDDLRKRGIELIHHPYIKSVREYLQTNGERFDVVILSRRDFACKHIENVRLYASQARLIFDTVDLHFLREEREANLTQDAELSREAEENRRLEYDLIDQADETWVVSPVEKEILQWERPEKSIEVVSNIVPVPGSATPFSSRRDLLFIGSFLHTPNIDAAIFFAREIFPSVRRQLADVRFYIIGDKAPPEVTALADESVIVTGFQSDVSTYFDSVRLSVAPLRYGAGVKGKINQSMAFGVPVIATSLAAEGMSLTDGEDVRIADSPDDFAAALIEIYQSEQLWQKISRNALEKAAALYSPNTAKSQLARIFQTAEMSLPSPIAPEAEGLSDKLTPVGTAADPLHLAV